MTVDLTSPEGGDGSVNVTFVGNEELVNQSSQMAQFVHTMNATMRVPSKMLLPIFKYFDFNY